MFSDNKNFKKIHQKEANKYRTCTKLIATDIVAFFNVFLFLLNLKLNFNLAPVAQW